MEKLTTSSKDSPPRNFARFLPLSRTQFLVLLLAGYFGGYVYLRYSKTFIRIENKSEAQRNLIIAPSDPWDDLAWEMTKEASKKLPILWPLEAHTRVEKPILNGLYWPLRKLESAYWTLTGR